MTGHGTTGHGTRRCVRREWGVLLATLVLVIAGAAWADPIQVDGVNRVPLSSFETLRDPGHTLTIADVRGSAAGRFESALRMEKGYSLGFTADAIWLRVELAVAPQGAGRHFLAMDIPNFDRLEVWASWTMNGLPDGTDADPLAAMGDRVAKAMPTRPLVVPLDLGPGRHTLWLRATSTSSMAVPLDLWPPGPFWSSEQNKIQFHTMLTAVMIVLGLGALLLAVLLPSLSMLLYAGSALTTAGHVMAMNGLDILVWGGHFFFGDISSVVWLVASGVFSAGFLLSVLPVRDHARWALPVLGLPALLAAAALGSLSILDDTAIRPVIIPLVTNLMLVILVVGLAASVQCRLVGYRPATYMIAGWLTLASGNVLAGLRNAGVVPWTDLTYYLPAYAPLLEVLFFGAMLAERLRLMRAERTEAQRALVAALRRNEAELAQRVAERTTALDHANTALREREKHLRLILEAAPFPITLSHANHGTTLYANRRARTLFLGDPDATRPMPPATELFQDPADHDRLLAHLTRDGIAENLDIAMCGPTGRGFWALAAMVAIDYESQPAHLLSVNDISRRRLMEQELTKAKELAEASAGLERAAREAQRQFLAMISHEFRTPLTVIAMATQNLELDVEEDVARDRLARIGRAVRYMNGMIDACLLDDRFEGAGLILRSGSLDLTALVRDVADAAQAAAPRHTVAVRVEDLPELAGDAQLLGIALSNLMENAVKYSPRGGGVEVTLARDGDEVVVDVADEGGGVPDGERDRIFEKYYRCAETHGAPGAGLGLYLTRRIVTAHGGTVGVRNLPGCGALFTVRLPLSHNALTLTGAVSRQAA